MGIVVCCLPLSVISSYAQNAGDIVSGTVTDSYGAVIGANVVEIDGANRIQASAVTDINGAFTFDYLVPANVQNQEPERQNPLLVCGLQNCHIAHQQTEVRNRDVGCRANRRGDCHLQAKGSGLGSCHPRR